MNEVRLALGQHETKKCILKSRKFSLFLQTQRDFALKALESTKDSCGSLP